MYVQLQNLTFTYVIIRKSHIYQMLQEMSVIVKFGYFSKLYCKNWTLVMNKYLNIMHVRQISNPLNQFHSCQSSSTLLNGNKPFELWIQLGITIVQMIAVQWGSVNQTFAYQNLFKKLGILCLIVWTQYSERPNTGHIRKLDKFVSGFRMVYKHPISGPVFKRSTSLDCLV
jgi:hypothetical protein